MTDHSTRHCAAGENRSKDSQDESVLSLPESLQKNIPGTHDLISAATEFGCQRLCVGLNLLERDGNVEAYHEALEEFIDLLDSVQLIGGPASIIHLEIHFVQTRLQLRPDIDQLHDEDGNSTLQELLNEACEALLVIWHLNHIPACYSQLLMHKTPRFVRGVPYDAFHKFVHNHVERLRLSQCLVGLSGEVLLIKHRIEALQKSLAIHKETQRKLLTGSRLR